MILLRAWVTFYVQQKEFAMKKIGGIVVIVFVFFTSIFANDEVKKTTIFKQEIDSFIKRPDVQRYLRTSDGVFRFLLDTMATCSVVAGKPGLFDRVMETLFYGVYSKLPLLGGLRSSSPEGMVLLGEQDTPCLHACLQKMCLRAGIDKPLLFLDMNNQECNAGAEAWGTRHSFIILNKKLLDVMSDHGVQGTLAHELAHIKHNHSLVFSVVLLSTFVTTLILFQYNCSEMVSNVTKLLAAVLFATTALLLVTRFAESQADATALGKFGAADDIAVTMQELIADDAASVEQYQQEYALVLERLQALQKKSPKIAAILGWIARKYYAVTSKIDHALVEQSGFDHPSLKQREEFARAKAT